MRLLPLHFALRQFRRRRVEQIHRGPSRRALSAPVPRRRAMSSPAENQAAGAPASQPVLPDEILEDIFLRLDVTEDLARTSAACTTFRRVVSARRFLHRFRCLHPPPVLGVLDSDVPPILGVLEFDAPGTFHPAELPHRFAPAAHALAQAADFTFSFLDTPHLWQVCDARDSRVLLYRRTSITAPFADLMVCDPLHRRHVQLPPIPDDLAAATGRQGLQDFDPFLDPDTDKDKEKQELSFRVICAVQCEHKLVTFHFSSVTGQWRGVTFNRTVPLNSVSIKSLERHYAHGCYFWTIAFGGDFMFMLNMHDMKHSVLNLPPGPYYGPRARAIVEAGEGMIGLVTISGAMLQLYSKSLQGTEWQHQRIIPLPEPNSYWDIFGAAVGYLLLQASPQDPFQLAEQESQYFTLHLKTCLVEALCVNNQHHNRGAHLYVSFPPPFSLPSI